MEPSNKHLADLISDESFVRWVKGQATTEEQEHWNKWLRNDQNNRLLLRRAQKLYRLPFGLVEESDAHVQLHRLQSAIDREALRGNTRTPFSAPKRVSRWPAYAAAAGIVIVLTAVFALMQQGLFDSFRKPAYATIHTDFGEKDSLRLPDGSQIILNANSTLRYQTESLASADVRLELAGEAYFSIIHNPKRRLAVQTPDGFVEDIGTKFNVNTRNSRTGVALVEGRVRVLKEDGASAVTESYEARPGDYILFSRGKAGITVSRENMEVHTSWTIDKLVLDNTPFRDIVSKLESTYGVDIRVPDRRLLNRKVSGSIRSPNLEIVLKGLAQTMRLNIQRDGKRIVITSDQQKRSSGNGNRDGRNSNQTLNFKAIQ